jgi:hypothetical protein
VRERKSTRNKGDGRVREEERARWIDERVRWEIEMDIGLGFPFYLYIVRGQYRAETDHKVSGLIDKGWSFKKSVKMVSIF